MQPQGVIRWSERPDVDRWEPTRWCLNVVPGRMFNEHGILIAYAPVYTVSERVEMAVRDLRGLDRG